MKLYPELKCVKDSVILIVAILVLVITITYTGFDPPVVELLLDDTIPKYTGKDARPTATVAFLGRL